MLVLIWMLCAEVFNALSGSHELLLESNFRSVYSELIFAQAADVPFRCQQNSIYFKSVRKYIYISGSEVKYGNSIFGKFTFQNWTVKK